jgi:putative PIN family toxin of toxin-antitoxin system
VKVVLDTNVVVSALLFPRSRLGPFLPLWTARVVTPLLSPRTTTELLRVLAYPKFQLDEEDITAVLAAYLPFTEVIVDAAAESSHLARCRDRHDQMFVDLAHVGHAAVLVSGDADVLALAPHVSFTIESPSQFLKRFP